MQGSNCSLQHPPPHTHTQLSPTLPIPHSVSSQEHVQETSGQHVGCPASRLLTAALLCPLALVLIPGSCFSLVTVPLSKDLILLTLVCSCLSKFNVCIGSPITKTRLLFHPLLGIGILSQKLSLGVLMPNRIPVA